VAEVLEAWRTADQPAPGLMVAGRSRARGGGADLSNESGRIVRSRARGMPPSPRFWAMDALGPQRPVGRPLEAGVGRSRRRERDADEAEDAELVGPVGEHHVDVAAAATFEGGAV